MGIEELKLVLQTLSGLADGAKEGFIWWLLVTEVFPRLVFMAGLGLVLFTVWKVADLISRFHASSGRAESTVKEIAELVGKYVDFPYPTQSRLRDVVDEVRKLKEQK